MQTDPRITQSLRDALASLKAGKHRDALALLVPICAAQPDLAEAHRLVAFAHLGLHDRSAAEAAFATAARADPRDPSIPACLAELAFEDGRLAEAERGWRTALAITPLHLPALIGLARLLLHDRATESLALSTPPVAQGIADARLLDVHARALTATGRHEEALAVRRRIAASDPPGPAADQNLAAAYLELARHREAVAAAKRALSRGGRSPELHYLHGRALQGVDAFDAAEASYRAALQAQPRYAEAARDLAQLIWMRTGDLARARRPLDELSNDADDPAAIQYRARLRDFAGDALGGYEELAALALRYPDRAEIHIAAGQAAIALDPAQALLHLERARRLASSNARLDTALAAAFIASGDPARAASLLEPLCEASPEDQGLIAFLATAWRLLGDPRYRALYDYDRLVAGWTIDTPPDWPDLPAYLADLVAELHALHSLRTHPIGQSLRHGTMAERNLLECETPAIRAFPDAVAGPIRSHLAWLGSGDDPVRRRANGDYRMAGLWTVKLQPRGFHVDHVHPMGWLSSACHIELPETTTGREGWLKLGEPGIPSQPPLAAEYFVRPEPGRLVLFPSYMWHGTVPFGGERSRLTVAFDLLPGRSAASR